MIHPKAKALVLLSGGLDSAANLALASAEGRSCTCLHVTYGQRASERELEAARNLSEFYGAKLTHIALPWLGEISGSALTRSHAEMPEFEREELDDTQLTRESARAVWVPNRNGLFIEVAASFADAYGIDEILVGFNAEEAATFPDNSADFIDTINMSLRYSCAKPVRVTSYTSRMSKTEIVQRLRDLMNFPFELLWSCYEGGKKTCGRCESCQRLSRALGAESG